MKTNTSKIKKLVLGLLVVGFALGTSAFTNRVQTVTYFNVSAPANSTTPSDYVLSDDHLCRDTPANNCSYTITLPDGDPIPANPPSINPSAIQKGQVTEL